MWTTPGQPGEPIRIGLALLLCLLPALLVPVPHILPPKPPNWAGIVYLGLLIGVRYLIAYIIVKKVMGFRTLVYGFVIGTIGATIEGMLKWMCVVAFQICPSVEPIELSMPTILSSIPSTLVMAMFFGYLQVLVVVIFEGISIMSRAHRKARSTFQIA